MKSKTKYQRESFEIDGDRVKSARLGKGWSVTDLAFRSDVSHTTIRKIERNEGVFPIKIAQKLSRSLGVPVSELLRLVAA